MKILQDLPPTALSQQNLLRGSDVSFLFYFLYHATCVNNCHVIFYLKKTEKFKITKTLFLY